MSLWSQYSRDLMNLLSRPGYIKAIIELWNTEVANIQDAQGVTTRSIPSCSNAKEFLKYFDSCRGYQWRLLALLRNHNVTSDVITQDVLDKLLREACYNVRMECPIRKYLPPLKV